MIDARDHWGLVASVAFTFVHRKRLINETIEDTEEFGDGLVGLTNAIKDYDPTELNDKGEPIQFSTFAWWCIHNAICAGLDRRGRKSGHLHCVTNWSFDHHADHRNNERLQAFRLACKLVDLMPDGPKKTAVIGWFLHGRDLIDIGKELGVRRSRAAQRKNEGLDELRKIARRHRIEYHARTASA